MALQVRTTPGSTVATLKTRESISQLTPEALERFRNVLGDMIARDDNWGFQFFAGWHGIPFDLCKHGDELFLPWHRAYLHHFELGLQELDPEVTVPWWNWIDEEGIPEAYEGDGQSNILASAPIRPFGQQDDPTWPRETFRQPGAEQDPQPWAPPLRTVMQGGEEIDLYEWMMSSTSYTEFRQRCERLHNNMHVWVGGTMTDPNWAAYDPLFWAHHAQVDRLWRIWQHRNPGGLPSPATLETPMTFPRSPSFLVSEVLDVKQLGYEYAGQTASVEGPA